MSIAPYTSFEVTDLSSNKQPYVNCTTEFGYFGNIGVATANRCNSMPTFLLTNNGIATVDASGLSILQPGIYTLNVAIDCSAANITTGGNFSMQFNFGTTRLVDVLIGGIIDSFGQTRTVGIPGMFSFGDTAPTYPGIISWLTDDGTSGSNTTVSNYAILGVGYMWYSYNTNCNIDRSFKSGILTTKITFIIGEPTTIYFNTFCSLALTMGTSYFTLKVVQLFPTGWTQLGTGNDLPATANWAAIASSSDGTKLVAGVYGTIMYRSSNSGNSWTPLGAGNNLPAAANWYSIASSSDGTKLAAVITNPGITNAGIWTSSNSGVNWVQRTSGLPTNPAWHSIASSSDGSKLAAVVDGGTIYTSSNSGNSWTPLGAGNNLPATATWYSIASSSDGSKLAAVAYGGQIWTSSNSGVNWVQRTSGLPATANWRYIASSSDGIKLAAVVFGGFIYTSDTSGNSWTPQASSQNWYSIASSSDGSKLAAVVYGGQIWTSSNSGVNWNAQIASLPFTALWHTISSSSDGSKLAAVVDDGTIYTSGVFSY